ncbi:MAG: UPF0280 family protein [Dehalococcoidales bacterium]|nr:UPF0280 family protein [Dehalococcoidales bacterium]
MYEDRTYRQVVKDSDLVSFTVTVKETNLYIRAARDLTREALRVVEDCRRPLEQYIRNNPLFLHSLEPLSVEKVAPEIVRIMADAGQAAGVGPMAAVAGALAEVVGKGLQQFSAEIIVENGGDIFISSRHKRLIGIYAGESPFTGKLALEIRPDITPAGVCTSSGTVGPSLSLGLADAAIVISNSTALADASATAVCNIIKADADLQVALERGQQIKGVLGIVVIKGDKMGAWGDVNLVSI